MSVKSIKKLLTISVLIFICFPTHSAYFWFQNDEWEEGDPFHQAIALEFCENHYRGDYACTVLDIDRECTIDKIGVLFYGNGYEQFNFWIRAYDGTGSLPNPGGTIPPAPTPLPYAQFTIRDPGFYVFDLNDPEVHWQIERKAGEKLVICLEYMGSMFWEDIDNDICTDSNGIDPGRNLLRRCSSVSSPPTPLPWAFAEDNGYTNNFIIRAGWWVPDPTATPVPTNTPTLTPTNTPTSPPTNTPTKTPTNTPTNTSTPTDTPTNTPTFTETPTNTPTYTPTTTPMPTDTPTHTPTETPEPSSTPTSEPSSTPTSGPTFTPEPSATFTVTPHPPTDTPTMTPTVEPTLTPTSAPTATPSPEPTMTPTATATTSVPTFTPTPVPTYEPFRLPFIDDFETILPWETESIYGDCLWHRDTVRYYSPYFAWAYNRGQPTFNYDTGTRNSCSLVSPKITLGNCFHPELAYMDWIQNEERPEFDICRTEITVDGGRTWELLFETYDKTERWTRRGPFDLTPYIGNVVQIRFRFDSVDSQFNNFEGWYIDDVSICERIDPTSTPEAPTFTPSPTPTATPDTSGRHGMELILNERVFYAGTTFHLEMILTNTTATDISVDTYLALDVYGTYWFWPSWEHGIGSRRDILTARKSVRETILWFVWPEYNGSFDDVYIWGATLEAGTSNLVGELDYVIFGCNL